MSSHLPTLPAARRGSLLARTALCSALCGVAALWPQAALGLPIGGFAQVSPGGGQPQITHTQTRMDVGLNAPRTVLSWTSFNVGPDETVAFNFADPSWIVLNRVTGLSPSKIEGVVEGRVGGAYGGNVWFTSQSSIIFGRGAQIDAGGVLAAIGTPDLAGFLDPGGTLFSFSGGDNLPDAKVMVLADTNITAHGGMVALAGPSIVTRTNAVVTARDGSALYGSARNFQIRMAPGTGGDFDLVDFIVPAASDGSDAKVAIDLAGSTTANAVFLAAVSRSAIGGAVINLEGLVTAQAAKADGGDVILSGGAGIASRLPGASLADAATTDLYLNRVTASRDLQVSNVGRVFARPWLRPPEDAKDPPSLAEEQALAEYCEENRNDPACGHSEGEESSCPPYCFAPAEAPGFDPKQLATLFDPTAISSITTGRDAAITATAGVELGRLIASRDIQVEGADVKANALIANRGLSAVSTVGDIRLATVAGAGAIAGHADVAIDALTAPQGLTVTSGRDVTIGDGAAGVSGSLTVSAPRNVTLNMGSGRVESVTAGVSVNLRGEAVEVGLIAAPLIFGQAASIRIDDATVGGDLYLVATAGDASVGSATVGDDIYLIATHGTASLGDATLTGQGPDAVGVTFAGNPDAADNGRVAHVQSTDFDARVGLATGGVTGATALSVLAGQDAFVEVTRETPAAFSVVAARDATLQAPTVNLGSVTAGRDLSVGSSAGDLTLTADLVATRNVSVSAAGALRVGDVRADQGSISLAGASVTAGAVAASEDLVLKATSGGVSTTSYAAGRDLIVQGSSLSLGSEISPVVRDLSITSLGNFTSTTPLSAGRALILDVAGKATLSQATAGQSARIVAADLDLTGTLTAPNVQIESRTGAITVGGAAGGGFVLDSAEFSRLRVSGETRIYAGSTTAGTRGDLTLGDLMIDAANTPRVTFLVGSDDQARVQGTVAPGASGGVLRIGDASDLSWRPGSILVTGSLGSATFANGGATYTDVRAFDEVRLAARQDILLGSQRFIGLVQDTPVGQIDIAAGLPAGVAPIGSEVGRVFVSAGRLEVSADGKVVQQNTAPLGSGGTAGLFFTGQFTPQLVIDPPQLVELWGAFVGSGGQVVSGATAGGALTFTVVDVTGQPTNRPDGAAYRFNSCDVGTTNCAEVASGGGGNVVADMNAGLLTTRDLLDGEVDGGEDGLAAVSSQELANPPVVLAIAPPSADEIVTDPVAAGAGSEEIWRKRRQTK